MDKFAQRLFDDATRMNRVYASNLREARPTVQVATFSQLAEVHAVFLGDRLLGLYRKEEAAIVTGHRIRQSDVYRDLTWQKVSGPYTGKQVWTCEAHGETITLLIEPRSVEG